MVEKDPEFRTFVPAIRPQAHDMPQLPAMVDTQSTIHIENALQAQEGAHETTSGRTGQQR